MILIIDFGSQTTHLIGRRIQEEGIDTKIVPPDEALENTDTLHPNGIILSGGPSSVYSIDGLLIDKKIFGKNIPILGICYGLQLMAQLLGGKVDPGTKKEYGPATFDINQREPNKLFEGINEYSFGVWMSHFDEVVEPPLGFVVTGSTSTVKIAAFEDQKRKFYGIQFHPEVHHTEHGTQILFNFLKICNEKTKVEKKLEKVLNSRINDQSIKNTVLKLKEQIGNQKAICALSGGIDSAVAASLTQKAIGDNLTCFYVDTGLMRMGETEQIKKTFTEKVALPLKVIYAEDEFLKALKGVTDPEQKRKIIGELFIRIFEKEALRMAQGKPEKDKPILIQGTIYPDVIESKGSKHAHTIKTHHNVGGIPSSHTFKIVEPLRQYYKDEVREIAKMLNFPPEMIWRHIFPGPGLAVRIIGDVTKEKLDILRKADAIVVEEIKKAGLYEDIWMAFAVLVGIKTTGVGGDERKYGETIAIRAIESKDTMTAEWVRLPYEVLAKISNRIVTEVFEVTRVVYDITTKPPATMEWE